MISLKVENISKRFISKKIFLRKKKEKIVLNNVSFNVENGSIFGLVGLNGIGKTTLIKIILDMLPNDKGNIEIFGINHKDTNSRKNICYLPEKFLPSQYLTGYEFLKISLSFFGMELDEKIKKYAVEMSKKIILDPAVLENVIGKYSKGMRQKLGLLACLMSNAKMLILDEPMSGLDPQSRIALKQTLKDYIKNGNSIFFSSHILEDVEEICDKMSVLHNGKIVFNGTPNTFLETYCDKTDNNKTMEKAFLKCIE